MKAYVFSIGEKTTNLCCELMSHYGFEVVLYKDKTSLWEKLKRFYTEALDTTEESFIRIDADIIPNKGVLKMLDVKDACLWHCGVGWDWYKQDRGSISVHHMKRQAIEICFDHIEEAKKEIRPETYLWRLHEFHYPRSSHVIDISCGMHGYGQQDHRQRIKQLKDSRNQDYDWELVEKIEALR